VTDGSRRTAKYLHYLPLEDVSSSGMPVIGTGWVFPWITIRRHSTAAKNTHSPSFTMPNGILSVPEFHTRYSAGEALNPLRWLKDVLGAPTTGPNGERVIPPIPNAQYTVQKIRNSNVLCYGDSNPLRPAKTAISDPANLALFTMVGAIDLTASNFGPFGSANTREPVSSWYIVNTNRG
jgi:hypothetical protein